MNRWTRYGPAWWIGLSAAAAMAGEAEVVAARAHLESEGVYRFEVSVRHADTGWEHYADAWQVLAPDGTLLGQRTLYHPHEQEQPFTRSLSGVRVPPGIVSVRVRARDSVHEFGGAELEVELPGR